MNFDAVKRAREMKARLDKIQKELSNTIIETDAGHGAVRVTMSGQLKVKSVKISPDAIKPEKAASLEKMVTDAVNDAIEKTQKAAARELKELTGGLKIPGLF